MDISAVEKELLTIFETSSGQAFTLSELETQLRPKLGVLEADDLRAGLWNLYYQGVARPFSDEHLEQRWKLVEQQKTFEAHEREPARAGSSAPAGARKAASRPKKKSQ